MEKRSKDYLNTYLGSLPYDVAQKYSSFSSGYFCADELNANRCADLILRGEKRASCSLEYWYCHEGEDMPAEGHLHVVTDWAGEPVCIVEVTSVQTAKFSEVTADFAFEEGEGDKSLSWWREEHWAFFSRECEQLGITPTEDMLLVLERFKVIHR